MPRSHSGQPDAGSGYELYFPSLYSAVPALSFPCDAEGAVSLDSLSERLRGNYLCARSLMGRAYAAPTVRAWMAR